MGKSHLIISTGVTLSVLSMANYHITLPVVAVTAVSALLPDIDEPNSLIMSRALPKNFVNLFKFGLVGLGVLLFFIGQAFAPWNMVLAALMGFISFMPIRSLRNVLMILIGAGLVAVGYAVSPWSYVAGALLIICALLPHRGLTHSVYGIAGWTLIIYLATQHIDSALWIAGGLSYLLHLLADAMTNRGIKPLPPFNFRLRLNLMSTGTVKGSLVESGFIGLTAVLVWFAFF